MKHLPILENFFTKFSQKDYFKSLIDAIKSETNFSISNISGSSFSLLISLLSKSISNPIIIISENQSEVENIRDDLDFLTKQDNICFLSNFEKTTNLDTNTELINTFFINDTLEKINKYSNPIIISTIEGLLSHFPTKDFYKENTYILEKDKITDRSVFIDTLEKFEYNREHTVEYPLEYSIKGSLIDFFPPTSINPYRVEFFDNKIESIRSFNQESQCSLKQFNQIELKPPANKKPKITKITSFYSYLQSIPVQFHLHSETSYKKTIERLTLLDNLPKIINVKVNDYLKSSLDFNFQTPVLKGKNIDLFKEHLKNIKNFNQKPEIIIFCNQMFHVKHYKRIFNDFNLKIIEGNLSGIVENHDLGIYIYPENEIYKKERFSKSFRKISKLYELEKIKTDNLNVGDFIVHLNYGIGKYLGLNKVEAFGTQRECIALEYNGGDKIYIPLENLRDVQKYKTPDDFDPKLSSLSSTEWERKKRRTKKSLEKITKEIIKLYADRMNSKGFACEHDTDMQKEMDMEFTYDETADQITAINEIKKDMESDFPMDRLLCGDVGFGKTEVAIRASFKAVSNSKQVAILVPTTILADQHYKSFCDRLENYPVQIEIISRFIKKKKQTEILNNLETGKTDIIIGTHRLLTKDIKFHNLGLLIIDEEHRFGVKHKENIKNIKKNIDILSLSATPIPRTLQFSLIGARDYSQINTPPKLRLPIYTDIIHFDIDKIKTYIKREINRKGQVFFVHNEIKSIHVMAGKLQQIFPDLRIRYAHGQMKEKELEPIMKDFINHNFDILVTTSIIESGIDISNVNTIFINKSHNFGLAQLYQLRGRVGRANRRAYCYLIIPKKGKLNRTAIHRLQTIKRYTSLGSGYSIALKDLEIRGTGNLFGLEQSGDIQSIGYDLYVKILKEAIEEQKINNDLIDLEEKKKIINVQIKHKLPAYFPEYYINSADVRLELYKRLSLLNSISALKNIQTEIIDRYGSIPIEGKKLLVITGIRILSSDLLIKKLHILPRSVKIHFSEEMEIENPTQVIEVINKITKKLNLSYKFLPAETFSFILHFRNDVSVEILKQFLFMLREDINL